MTGTTALHGEQESGSERIFEDSLRRIWSAGHSNTPTGTEALVFTCLSDPRQAVRAVTLDAEVPLTDAGSDKLRMLLGLAPRLGRL
jgi:hypothetical protein